MAATNIIATTAQVAALATTCSPSRLPYPNPSHHLMAPPALNTSRPVSSPISRLIS